jgi:hypothetical protein
MSLSTGEFEDVRHVEMEIPITESWKNRNDRFHEEHADDNGTRFFRGLLIAVPLSLIGWYFVGWWVIPFFRALAVAR